MQQKYVQSGRCSILTVFFVDTIYIYTECMQMDDCINNEYLHLCERVFALF